VEETLLQLHHHTLFVIFLNVSSDIQLCTVKPIPDEERAELSSCDVPMRIAEYYKVNEIDTFQYDRPFHEGKKDEKNEFRVSR
jgi:hypothetical protein